MEETRQYSALATLRYQRGALPGGIAFVALAIGAAIFVPRMDVARLMLDWRLWIAVVGMLYLAQMQIIPMLANIIRERPGVEITAHSLRIWVAPERDIALTEICKIEVGDDVVQVHDREGRVTSINTASLDGARYFFFDEVGPRLPHGADVVELF